MKRTNYNQVVLVSVAIRPVYHNGPAKRLSGISHPADVGADGSAITFNPGREGGRGGVSCVGLRASKSMAHLFLINGKGGQLWSRRL